MGLPAWLPMLLPTRTMGPCVCTARLSPAGCKATVLQRRFVAAAGEDHVMQGSCWQMELARMHVDLHVLLSKIRHEARPRVGVVRDARRLLRPKKVARVREGGAVHYSRGPLRRHGSEWFVRCVVG